MQSLAGLSLSERGGGLFGNRGYKLPLDGIEHVVLGKADRQDAEALSVRD